MATGGPTATGGPVVTEAPVTGGPRTSELRFGGFLKFRVLGFWV